MIMVASSYFIFVSGDAMLNFMNDNWKTMTLEFGLPIFDKPVQKIYNSVKTYLSSMPLEEIVNV